MRKYLSVKKKCYRIKLLKYVVLFFMISGNYYGQLSGGNDNNINKIIPATPETYSIFKAGDFPVDYRTGKLNVSVPIHTLNTKYGVSIPISLTYNTGGIKVDETSGVAGLGWSLAVPNSISVEQHGKSDLVNNAIWFSSDLSNYQYSEVNLESLPVEIRTKLQALAEGTLDTQPDIFHYNLPTVSGSFVRDSNGNFHTIPYENIKISYSETDHKFQIIDPKGIKYTLRVGNSVSSSSGIFVESSPSSFFLEKIILLNGEEINFKYEKLMSYQTVTHSYENVYAPIEGYDPPCRPAVKDVHNTTTNRYMDILLTEIKYGNETVTLNYKTIIEGILGRKDLSTIGTQNTYALDQVIVNNSAGNIISNYKFIHTYFGSGGGLDYRSYRLKLLRVDNILENSKYSFDYNENYSIGIGSFSQDIWGYYNGRSNLSLIPNMNYFNVNYDEGGDRNVYPDYSQAYILKKLYYPTGGYSAFIYENNTIWDKLLIPQKQEIEYGTIDNYYTNTQNEYDQISMITPQNENFLIDVDQSSADEELRVEFSNSCSNQIPDQIPENGSSMGIAYIDEFINNQWKNLANFSGTSIAGQLTDQKFFLHPQAPKRIRTVRTGNCSISLRVYKVKYIRNNNQNNPVGGIRIKSIEDFDGSTTYTKRQFEYNNPTLTGNRSSAHFATPLEFVKSVYKSIRNTGYDYDILCSPYALSADQAVNSSLTGKDVVNYEYVTEHTLGKGKKVYQFDYLDYPLKITHIGGFNPYQFINKNLLNETSYSQNGTNPLREIIYNYTPYYSKNILSADYTSTNSTQVVPSGVMGIYTINKWGALYYTSILLNNNPIESGIFLLDEMVTKDYINGNTVTAKVNSNYSVDNIQKPINLTKQTTISPDGTITATNYSYAQEKGNQLMISKNMIGIPLETTTTQTIGSVTKTLDKSETIYPTSLPTIQAGNLLLPLSSTSYDVLNNTSSTDVTYDKYDEKGNILQYTTKDGVSTTIIWGYHNTQPIAKITGAKLSDIQQSLIDVIVTASDIDAVAIPNNDESAFLTTLDNFRKDTSLINYQVTMFSYDPLVGVRSITPPSGIREFYKYDSANRLEKIMNVEGKVLKTFKYNYKN
jgi:hypothetical protein